MPYWILGLSRIRSKIQLSLLPKNYKDLLLLYILQWKLIIIFWLNIAFSRINSIFFLASLNKVWRTEFIYCIFVYLLIKSCYCLFFMELWHFNIDLVWADHLVCLLLLLHCFFFVTNTTEFITIAAIWIVSFIFPYTVYLFKSLLFCLVFDRVFCWLLFLSVNFKRVASFNYFFNLTWIFFMSFIATFVAVFH